MDKKGIVPNHDGLPDCRTIGRHPALRNYGHDDDVIVPEIRKDPPPPVPITPTSTYWASEFEALQLEGLKKALAEFAKACKKTGAVVTFPQENLVRIRSGTKAFEFSFVPERPLMTIKMLRRAVEFLE